MKFRSTSSTSPYLNRRDQYRLLTLVAMLSMVMLAAHAAKNPKNWYWLTGPPKNEQQQQRAASADEAPIAQDAPRPLPLADDEFVARPGLDDQRTEHSTPLPDAKAEKPVPQGIAVPLEPELLKPINDHMVSLQQKEVPVYYEVLDRLKGLTDQAMQQSAEKGFTYSVITAQPDLLRGRILSIEGELQRLSPLLPPADRPELGTVYDAWIFTRESGNNPIRVVVLDAGGVSPAEQYPRRPRVRFVGYFFKLYGYPTQSHELHRAPMFLSRELHRLPSSTAHANDDSLPRYVFGILTAFGVIFAGMVAYLRYRDRTPRRRRREASIAATPEEIAALNDIETHDVGEMLKRLASNAPSSPHRNG